MGRTNDDYDLKRRELLRQLSAVALRPDARRPSLRELARAVGVQPNTLRHYFGDREGLLSALMTYSGEEGRVYLEQVRLGSDGVLPGLRRLLGFLAAGWTPDGLAGLHAAALAEGMGEATVGPAYVQSVLEPTLQAFEAALAERVDWTPTQRRVAVLALISPVLLALLHQHQLGGQGCRPLDWPVFLEEHLAAWARGWGLSDGAAAPTGPAEAPCG